MKILMINSVCGIKSTGRICTDLAVMLEQRGHDVKVAYSRETVPPQFEKYAVRIGTDRDVKLHGLKARLTDGSGFGSTGATKRFIKWVKEYDPDVIHLHNIHGYFLDIRVLFDYLRTCGKPILWSFYDCWSFTGHCAHFDFNGCSKWQTGCKHCAHLEEYPKSFVDRTKRNYKRKRSLFTGIPNLQLIVPSLWMREMVESSFMKDYPCRVLPNGIDTNQFYPRDNRVKEEFGVGDRHLLVGVSSVWQKMKGINYLNRLAEALPEDKYSILLVGSNQNKEYIDSRILRVDHTHNIDELCQIYTAADVFVNPTLQESQGLTTTEAFACGTPAVVFRSGGAAECVDDTCGITVKKGSFKDLYQSVLQICENKPYSAEACIAKAKTYDKQACYQVFMELYDSLQNEQ